MLLSRNVFERSRALFSGGERSTPEVLAVNHSVDFFKRIRAIRLGMEQSAGNAASSLQVLRSQESGLCVQDMNYVTLRFTLEMATGSAGLVLLVLLIYFCIVAVLVFDSRLLFAGCFGVLISDSLISMSHGLTHTEEGLKEIPSFLPCFKAYPYNSARLSALLDCGKSA